MTAPTLEQALLLARTTKAFATRRDGRGRVLFTYLYASPEVFALEGARELRGIVYDERSGEVVSRPFHKFFNYREFPHGLGAEDFEGEEVFLAPKVDGYLAQAYLWEGEVRLASRHSLEPPLVGPLARGLWDGEHERHARKLLEEAPLTLLYEVVSPEAPVLVRYEAPGLHFIAARRLDTGEYLLPGVHLDWPLSSVRWERVPHFDPEAFFQDIREERGVEGFVAFLPGRQELVKFKTGWAFRLAAFLKDPAGRFLEAFTGDALDDLLGTLAHREDLQDRVARAASHLTSLCALAADLGRACQREGMERRAAWERVAAELREEAYGPLAGILRAAAMEAYAGKDAREAFLRGLARGDRGREALRPLFGVGAGGGEETG